MVHRRHRGPYVGAVTVLANVGRLYVCGALAGRIGAVVAAETIVDDIDVVEIRRSPRDSCVAVIAVVATCDMRRVFAGRSHAVVARATGAEDLRMVNREDGLPDVGAMAVFTDVARLDVRLVFAGGIGAVMTFGAATSKVCMIEVGR